MPLKLEQKKLRAALVIALSVTLLVGALSYSGLLDRLEWISYDQRMRYHSREFQPHPDIAVVLVDEASLQAMNPLVGRWPWPRSVYADLLEFFAMGGARAVAFDILFPEQQMESAAGSGPGEDDRRFIAATGEAGNAYHAMQLFKEHGEEGKRLNLPLPEDFVRRHSTLQVHNLPEGSNNAFLLPIPGLYREAQGVGIVEISPDGDGVYRRVRPFGSYQGHAFPMLSIAPLLPQLGNEVQYHQGSVTIGEQRLPLDSEGYYAINMPSTFQPYSISGIFASIRQLRRGEVEDMLVYPDEFEDKIVFIGASAIGIQDIKATPLSSRMPGVYLHASMTSNILSKRMLQPLAVGWTMFFIGLFSLLTAFSTLTFSQAHRQALIPLLLVALYGAWAVMQFGNNIIYPIAAPVMAILNTWLGAALYLAVTEGNAKRRVRTMLGQYVSPTVLAEVIDKYDKQLGAEIGSRENLTILFSDIRGFTAISENVPAEKVVEMLNTYFSEMTEVIFRYEGTLDKFIGDAIMAFWGAPIRLQDHADRSLMAAIEMQRALQRVNKELEQMTLPEIAIGVGLNSGEVVLGNIGSSRKLDYTIIGDNVNLASRLEGLTKYYGTPVLISEYTFEQLHQPVPCALIDLVQVKGKQVPIRLYSPLALPQDDTATVQQAKGVAELTHRAFQCYLEQRWDEAIALYHQLPNEKLRDVFINRCRQFQLTPPQKDWDGVYTMTTK